MSTVKTGVKTGAKTAPIKKVKGGKKRFTGRIPSSIRMFQLREELPVTVKKAVRQASGKKNPITSAVTTLMNGEKLKNPSVIARVRNLLCVREGSDNVLLVGIDHKYQRNYRADDGFKNNLFATALLNGVIHGVFAVALHKSGSSVWGSLIDGQQRTSTLFGIMDILDGKEEFVFNASKVSDTSFNEGDRKVLHSYDGYSFEQLPSEIQERFLNLQIHMDIYTGITQEEESALYDRFNGHTNSMEKSESYKAKYCHYAVYQELEKVFTDPKYNTLRTFFRSDSKHQAHMLFWEICGCLLFKRNNGNANISRAVNAGKLVPMLFETFRDPETAPDMQRFVAEVRGIFDYVSENHAAVSLAHAAFGEKKGSKWPSRFAMKVMFMYFSEEENRDGNPELFSEGLDRLYSSKAFRENFQSMYEGTTGRMWKIRMFADIWSTYIGRMRRGVKSPMAFADLEAKTWRKWDCATKAFKKGVR